MFSPRTNEHKEFAAAVDLTVREVEAALSRRHEEMGQEWDDLDKGWQDLNRKITKIGVTKPLESEKNLLWLNVGGSPLATHRSVLKRKDGGLPKTFTLAHIFATGTWDGRLPRDSDGRIVLDESPACIKQIVHGILKSSQRGELHAASGIDTSDDEEPYLSYVSRALHLREPAIGMAVIGGSTVLEGSDVSRLTATLQGWYPDQPNELELLYRASRDGWTSAAFHSRCVDDSPSTITLLRVGGWCSDSIVGGFSSVPWTGRRGYCDSPGAFLFMLKNGSVRGGSVPFQPVQWGVRGGREFQAVYLHDERGPTFAAGDLNVQWGCDSATVGVGGYAYSVGMPYLRHDNRPIIEIETFRVCPTGATERRELAEPTCSTNSPTADKFQFPSPTASAAEHRKDIDTFGKLIASSFMEQRIALREAQIDLAEAGHEARATANALAAVYGPDVAAGKEDPVVELTVRGIRMTTLLSTLQACPESFLATKFNQERWPATDKDVDENGRQLIDCSPSVFAKVLDVLRMRKREAWAGIAPKQGCDGLVRVKIKAEDRGAFEEFVEQHFPGNLQRFIMDCVEPTNADSG
ncbi:unnamed protein product [Pylaiella littoralis]